jgi:hypothetical protein
MGAIGEELICTATQSNFRLFFRSSPAFAIVGSSASLCSDRVAKPPSEKIAMRIPRSLGVLYETMNYPALGRYSAEFLN